VLDTKWKIPKDGHPADEDLKQMFTYNLHLGARHSLLIYPRANPTQSAKVGEYAPSSELPPGYRHSCGMCYLDLFDTTNRLRKDIGVELARHIFATSH
jgi:5-methylcytosine-specific restriction enzyme subunit McrC